MKQWKIFIHSLACCGFVFSVGANADTKTEMKKLEEQKATLEAKTKELNQKIYSIKKADADAKKKGIVDIFHTQFKLPLFTKAPKIDGKWEEGEWSDAIGVPLGTGANGRPIGERPSAIYFLGWDPNNIYAAARLPLRKGEKLKRLGREPVKDNVSCKETAIELFIDNHRFGSHPSLCRWQFMGNAVGNKWDYEDQYQIGQRFPGWDAKWDYAQSLSKDGKYWTAEIAIPRESVYQNKPITVGEIWKIGFAIDLQNPGICWSGFYGARIPATFSDTVPAIVTSRIEEATIVRGLAFDMTITNTLSTPFEANVLAILSKTAKDKTQQVIVEKTWPISLAPSKKTTLNVNEALKDKVEDKTRYLYTIAVKRGDDILYSWNRELEYGIADNKLGVDFVPDPNPFVAEIHYAPISNYLRLVVDKYDYPNADAVKAVDVILSKFDDVKVINKFTITEFKYGKASKGVKIPALSAGKYKCVFNLLDAKGKTLVSRTNTFDVKDLKQFPWINNTIGKDDVVPEIFKPLKMDGEKLLAFEKEITTSSDGLLAQAVVKGQKLLSKPVYVAGKNAAGQFVVKSENSQSSLKEHSATHADYAGKAVGGNVEIDVNTRWEYDSTAKVELKLSSADGKPVNLESLKLVIPFSPEASRNFMVVGNNMRLSCKAGQLPGNGKTGVIWRSTEVPMQERTVGSFVPVIWIGNRSMGMTWFADNDKGWWPNDKFPAQELIRREDGGVDLVLNIASTSVTLDKPRDIVFGLNINPVRPMSDHISGVNTFGYINQMGRWKPGESKRREFALRYGQDTERLKEVTKACHDHDRIFAPYTEMSSQDIPMKEHQYFKEEYCGDPAPPFSVYPSKVFNDMVLYWSDKAMREQDIDGYYFDNVYPRISYSDINSAAYRLPDGRVQPGYCLWGLRDHFKRMRTLLEKNKKGERSRLCIHNTRFQFPPVMAFADLAMGGEMATPKMGSPDFMEMYPREFVEIVYSPYLWGYRLSHLYHFQRESYVNELGEHDEAASDKVHRGACATMMNHGMETFFDYSTTTKFNLLKSQAGGELTFIPAWEANGLFKIVGNDKNAGVAIWKAKDFIIALLVNYDKKEQIVQSWFDFPKLLKRPAKDEQRVIVDFDTFQSPRGLFTSRIDDKKIPRLNTPQTQSLIPNTIRARIPGHDYQMFLIGNFSRSKGFGF